MDVDTDVDGGSGVPLHLAGNNRPVGEEVTAAPTRVVGEVPAELRGRFLRNGPNPRTGWSAHLFDGDGMIHSVALGLEGGAAGGYRNRYVRTPLYEHPGRSRFELAYDPGTGRIDHRVTTANTHVVAHAGRLLALEEGGLPYEITPDLDTVGPYDFGGALATPMTAHPKTCPTTGELLFFGYQLRRPYLTYHRASPAGELQASTPLTLPAATMLHDFAVTATRAVFMDSPIVFAPGAAAAGGSPWRWDDDHPARLGVLPRAGGGDADLRWFAIEPCHLSHAVNAYDEGHGGAGHGGDRVVVTGTRLPREVRGGAPGGGLPTLHRWTLDLASGRVSETALDDTPSEYPRVADDRIGRPHRFAYTTSFVLAAEPERSEIYKYDLATPAAGGGTTRTTHVLPAGHTCGEPVFVGRSPGAAAGSKAAEDDGFLLTFVHDRAEGTSYLVVLDATDVAAPPLAEVHLPVRVPAGFHGTWLPVG
ncbi:MAG TPA: carotenoid oxygenase family protein [Acidimicrobiales bacterium]|nr:carotenoid oxygenase family protein [Acidimicrobiales bacterium]